MGVKDLINETYIHCDQVPSAGSSDATSDGTANVGTGVTMNGWRYATLLASAGAPSGTSDGTMVARLQYATLSDIASDNADTDFASFTTDAVSASLAWATSDSLNNGVEGATVVHVDLWANGMTRGVVRSQVILNGTNVAPTEAWIILSRRNGGLPASAVAVARF